jgi:thiol-disulfide isomerase/thioredoxin
MSVRKTFAYLTSILWVVRSQAFSGALSTLGGSYNANSLQARYYSNLADPPNGTTQQQEGFQNRMRRIATEPVYQGIETGHPSVRRITSLAQFRDDIASGKGNNLKVVRFFADYCRACRAMTAPFYRLAQTKDGEMISWYEVPATSETTKIIRGLSVPSVPYCQIYQDGLLVEELRLKKQFLSDFTQILESYEEGICRLPEEPNSDSGLYEAPYQRRS